MTVPQAFAYWRERRDAPKLVTKPLLAYARRADLLAAVARGEVSPERAVELLEAF